MPRFDSDAPDPLDATCEAEVFVMKLAKSALLALALSAAVPLSSLANDYNPIPKGWNIKIELPGILSVGAEYCTQSGVCHFVGAAQDCTVEPPAPQDPCHKTGVPLGSNCVPRKVCQLSAASGVEMPVYVLAESQAGSVIVRVQNKNYATPKDHVSVVFHGVRIPLMKYGQCYSPGTHVTVAPIGQSPCPPLPPG
jgi:hypothetical protein